MLAYTIAIGSRERAEEEIAGELQDRRTAVSKYRRESLLLLVPLAAPALALRRRRPAPHKTAQV